MASKWEIWLANLEPAFGSEQGKTRPVLIISNDEVNKFLNVVNAIPITTRKENRDVYPNEVFISSGSYGLKNDSLIIAHQIRTLDKKRLLRKLGQITIEEKQKEVFEALKFQFEIK
ncbi:MAG: type II toxin-antitoxin system PemK/MazF family toxin [Bacteroidota bacterium]|nr:type II toxin-antitoxin system PemK/MazF family toxin [Bacteroidota bacterium]